MARSGALIPLLVGGAVAAGVVYAMTRETKAKSAGPPQPPQLPEGSFEPLPPGALPEDTLAKYQQALYFPADPSEMLALIGELEALGARYEAAQVREVLGIEGDPLPPGALPDELLAAYQGALMQPETFSHADLLDLADDLDMVSANYEAEQIRDLAAALHGVEPPTEGGGAPLAEEPIEPVRLDPADLEYHTPPFVPPGTMPAGPSIWDQLASNLGQMIPPGLETPVSLPAPPSGQQGAAPPVMPGQLPGDFAPPPAPRTGPPGTYTVQAGDTLWQLAERGTGLPERWGELVALNLGQYAAHPEWGLVLHPGDVIKVPADFNL